MWSVGAIKKPAGDEDERGLVGEIGEAPTYAIPQGMCIRVAIDC